VKLKAGIIGAGGIAQYAHIPCYKKIEGVELAAIADVNEEKRKFVSEKFGIPKTFKNWEEMLEEDIDMVSICTPSVFHAVQSIKAMEAGKHVLCEKPLCVSIKEVNEVFAASRRTGRKFMGAMHKRFSEEAKAVKSIVNAGLLGEIYYIKASWTRRRGIPNPGSWFTNRKLAGGGALMDIGVHAIDLAVYLSGLSSLESVSGATCMKFTDRATDGGWPPHSTRKGNEYIGKMDVEELACGFARFAGGQTLFAEACWAGNIENGFNIDLFGTKAGVHISDPGENKKESLAIYSETEGVLSNRFPLLPHSNPFGEEMKHFIDCIRNNTQPVTMKEEVVTVMQIIESIYQSAEKEKPVRI